MSSKNILVDTVFVADITYKYDVKFIVDNNTYNSQIVVKNNVASIPTNPIKTNYVFKGWSINGSTVIDLSTYKINSTTTFYAVFEPTSNGTFAYSDGSGSVTISNGTVTNITGDSLKIVFSSGNKVNDNKYYYEQKFMNNVMGTWTATYDKTTDIWTIESQSKSTGEIKYSYLYRV